MLAAGEVQADLEMAAAGYAVPVRRRVVLDRGVFLDGVWVSLPQQPVRVYGYAGAEVEDGGEADVGIGWNTFSLARECGEVAVPFWAGPHDPQVSLPYPDCSIRPDAPELPSGERLDRRERAVAELREVQTLGLLPDVPVPEGPEDDPARWLTLAEAQLFCGFYGGRVPTADEWRAAGGTGADHRRRDGPVGVATLDRSPSIGPFGHEDLDGNVAEWVAEGAAPETEARTHGVVGGSWLRAGEARAVPATARSDEIGFRCAYGG
jgi:hypothetical protein